MLLSNQAWVYLAQLMKFFQVATSQSLIMRISTNSASIPFKLQIDSENIYKNWFVRAFIAFWTLTKFQKLCVKIVRLSANI